MRRPSLTERFALWLLRRHIPRTPEARLMLEAHADMLLIEQLSRDARDRLRVAVVDAKTKNILRANGEERS